MQHKLTLRLMSLYNKLYSYYGPQNWWPARNRFEVILGAILTQNTNWKNVEKAIANLRKNKLLSVQSLRKVSRNTLAVQIKPSGYFNIKADRIKCFLDFLVCEYGGSLTKFFREETETLRKKLLTVKGIGPETADSILLYSAKRPVFVVDAYTRRVFSRHGFCHNGATYDELQTLFSNNLKADVQMFNEYHALLVRVGKDYCGPKPKCSDCPLFEK